MPGTFRFSLWGGKPASRSRLMLTGGRIAWPVALRMVISAWAASGRWGVALPRGVAAIRCSGAARFRARRCASGGWVAPRVVISVWTASGRWGMALARGVAAIRCCGAARFRTRRCASGGWVAPRVVISVWAVRIRVGVALARRAAMFLRAGAVAIRGVRMFPYISIRIRVMGTVILPWAVIRFIPIR